MTASEYIKDASILVVDDDPVIRTVVAEVLTSAGADVRTAADGNECLDRVREQGADLILLDIMMPGTDGLEVARRIRAEEAEEEALVPTSILMLTAMEGKRAMLQALDGGADDFLSKPFNRAVLVSRSGVLLRVRRSAARVEKLLRARERMAEALVHDLRNPLSALRMNAYLLAQGPGEDWGRMVADVREASSEMSALLDDLLLAARSEEMGLAPEIREHSLRRLLEEATARANRLIPATGQDVAVDLRVSTNGAGDGVRVDDKLMGRVLDNLLGNALSYGVPRGGTIRVEGSNHGVLRIHVDDEGPGVPAEKREWIFQRFARAAGTGSSGFGIGLSFCQQAVTAHGGRIWVEEAPSGGARFVVEIPDEESSRKEMVS